MIEKMVPTSTPQQTNVDQNSDNIRNNYAKKRKSFQNISFSSNEPINKCPQVTNTNHLLNNFNIIKYNNVVYPRLFIEKDVNEYYVNLNLFEEKLILFRNFLKLNNISLENILTINHINLIKPENLNIINNHIINIRIDKIIYQLNQKTKKNRFKEILSGSRNNLNYIYFSNSNNNYFFYQNDLNKPISYLENKFQFLSKKRKDFFQGKSSMNTDKNFLYFNRGNNDENNIEFKEEKNESVSPVKPHARRGRKGRFIAKKPHSASDDDNIVRKIQVHFLTFLIYFANDIVKSVLGNEKRQKFRDINYDIKKKVNLSYINILRAKTIGEILQFKASIKSKNRDGPSNKEIYTEIKDASPVFNSFFNKNFVDIFTKYYYNYENIYNFEGKKINISWRTKNNTFRELAENIDVPFEKLNYITHYYFIEGHRKKYKNIFFVQK